MSHQDPDVATIVEKLPFIYIEPDRWDKLVGSLPE